MRGFVALALLGLLLALAGCGDDERKPIPVIQITVLREPGTYLLDGQRLYLTELRTELQRTADKYRRPTTRNARATVIVSHDARLPYDRIQEVLGMCAEAGLDKVETQVRNEGVAPR